MTEVMRVENIGVHFNGEQILHDLSFSLYTGEMLGIIGPNGSGKSTLLKVILGLIKPQRGKVKTKKEEKKVAFGYYHNPEALMKELPFKLKTSFRLDCLSILNHGLLRKIVTPSNKR